MIQLHLNGLNQNCLNFKERLKSSATIMQYGVNMFIYAVNRKTDSAYLLYKHQ